MIRGRENRDRFLGHVSRILKPGGRFVVHAHNASFRFGFGLGRRGGERGDRVMPQHRGGADLTLHHFTRAELIQDLARHGFRIVELQPVSIQPDAVLRFPWLASRVRAYGYLFAGES